MNFVWNDGGRAAAGFVGLTGDCVTRSIAIATGIAYRDVYQMLGKAAERSPRDGLPVHVAHAYLRQNSWKTRRPAYNALEADALPSGVVIVHLVKEHSNRGGHFCCVIDHEIHDTWNPSDDDDYQIETLWTFDSSSHDGPACGPRPAHPHSTQTLSDEQSLTQNEFDKILKRLRALDSTASNQASTEGEKRNALRMMQNLMLRHNLSREDIVDDDNVDQMRYTRMACPVNGRRACSWEKSLAAYLTREIFPLTQWYFGTRGHRTLFWFYGPLDDVKNCLALFRELVVTIAAAAKLQYGGYSRGSGASYAEGYVAGLPKILSSSETSLPSETATEVFSESALIHARTLAVCRAASDWLHLECDVSVVSSYGAGRDRHDPAAQSQGKRDGATHDVTAGIGRARIGQARIGQARIGQLRTSR